MDESLMSVRSVALNGSSGMRHFQHSDAIDICSKIVFDLYMCSA